jgi:hypothetical protein
MSGSLTVNNGTPLNFELAPFSSGLLAYTLNAEEIGDLKVKVSAETDTASDISVK